MTIKDLNEKTKKCCFCGRPLSPRECNNPWPVNKDEEAVCCSDCNESIVLQARLLKKGNPYFESKRIMDYINNEIQKSIWRLEDIIAFAKYSKMNLSVEGENGFESLGYLDINERINLLALIRSKTYGLAKESCRIINLLIKLEETKND